MRKIYTALCGVLLAVLLLIGLISGFDKDAWYSEKEERSLAEFPKLTVSGLLDGSFCRELSVYYTDTFPGREDMLETLEKLESFYVFGGDGTAQNEETE